MDRMNYKWLAVLSGIALILAIPYGWPYSYYILLRWFISISSLIMAYGFFKSGLKGWGLVFGSVVFLFNPIFPVYLTKQAWVPLDFISAILFLIAAYSINKKSNGRKNS